MDDPNNYSSEQPDIKNVLPDVVHSQQIPTLGAVVSEEARQSEITIDQETNADGSNIDDVTEESISEHIPSKLDYSVSDSFHPDHTSSMLKVQDKQDRPSSNDSLNLVVTPTTHDVSKQSTSLPLDINAISDIQLLSEESPLILPLSSEQSNDQDDKSPSEVPVDRDSAKEKSEYLDSLNEESSNKSISVGDSLEISKSDKQRDAGSSSSDEIIKLDIRGQGAPKNPFSASDIIFGLLPEGSTVPPPNIEPLPVFQNLLSPFLVGARDNVKIEEVFDFSIPQSKETTPQKSSESSLDKVEENDLLVEEVVMDCDVTPSLQNISHEKHEGSITDGCEEKNDGKVEDSSIPTQPKSMAPEETMSFSTMSTDYKTICEEYHVKLVHLEDAITQRDQIIEELTVSLQRSNTDQRQLKQENEYLTNEVHNLQQIVSEHSISDHDTIKAQISDFMKYHSLIKDDSTKFYSAVMSGGSSIQSSNGEKDMDREEITVNHSRSDLKTSEASNEFEVGFENKLVTLVSQFDECIEENARNRLREGLVQLLCDEIGKMKLDFDTDLKELESQMQQDQQAYTKETNHLRELLSSVKAGNADIETLRKELDIKHEKEMANLRMYFEKKCSDMERSYSEEVWRGRTCDSPTYEGGGDQPRRARSADLPSLTDEAMKPGKKLEQHLEELRSEHASYVSELRREHCENIAALQAQISQLKAQLQTVENTEAKLSLYQQDIDLELEKANLEMRLEEVRQEVRQEVVQELQDKIQVLLSDPDAEVSSWPLELVALRDKIHGDARAPLDKESSLGQETTETDKWRQRRNNSFDQTRRLEEVTKERDGLRRVATQLQLAVGQLLQYCATAEDELNNTVLATLLPSFTEESRPSSPQLGSDLGTEVGRHVHFAPDVRGLLAPLEEEQLLLVLRSQRDLSQDLRRDLDLSLARLRREADALLTLSMKKGGRNESRMLESSQVHISELVDDMDTTNKDVCNNCEMHKKCMEQALSECEQREQQLRAELRALAALTAGNSADVVAEGYGAASSLSRGRPGAEPAGSPTAPGAPASPRGDLLAAIDALTRERDDLHQQAEAARRQLRSTRQFVEEQAAEREAERDEFSASLAQHKAEIARLTTRLQHNARILSEMYGLVSSAQRNHLRKVEQLETQTREMNQIIADLESRKLTADEELKASEEKVQLLRDIVQDLEQQLEQKNSQEAQILQELEVMKQTIDERDSKMRSLLQQLQEVKVQPDCSEQCQVCSRHEEQHEMMNKFTEECQQLEQRVYQRVRIMELAHGQSSRSCSEPSEDVSIRDQKHPEPQSPPAGGEWGEWGAGWGGAAALWAALAALARAEDAALKRVADADMRAGQLRDVAQEIRAERDVLQARMSEQALKISSLSARLEQQRHRAASAAHAQLGVQLHDARAEVQHLKDELDSKDKQLTRMKQTLEERKQEQHVSYGNIGNPKDKVHLLERELSSAQSRIAQLEALAATLEADKEQLQASVRELHRSLAEKEEQLNELMAIKLDDENDKSEVDAGKISARTLSDIVSISEFDEQDQQMRRAELKHHNLSLTGAPYVNDARDKSHLNKTMPPEVQRANMSSLNIDYHEHFDVNTYTPRADSLPAHLTSTHNKGYTKNVNETTVFGIDKFGDSVKHSTAQNIPDNCSMYPNRDISDSKNNSIEPKKINFSLEASKDNKNEDEFTSLRELGITLDINQENFPDILTQLKHEIKKSRTELEKSKSELKNAEEQLCEFPALKEEVEELKCLLENTMATMANDKKFYENQLDSFSSNKKLLEQRLTELTQEVNDKTKDLHLLKEDILRRENMILELAKEKRNLTNKLAELEVKMDELEGTTTKLDRAETENIELKAKISHLQKLEQLISEKNQQIDSLNQHLDRLDDLQRCLHDKSEEIDTLKVALDEKSNEVFHLQNTVEAMTQDIAKANEENCNLNAVQKDLIQKLTKLEKEQENASIKLQSNEGELHRLNSINNELTSKINELKLLTDTLKDKETEIEILNEDINSYHEEIATLKEQLQMVSRSPSPRTKVTNGEERKQTDRQASNDKKQLVKIRKQISLLQHELDFHKKELNDKAFELAKAKLDVTELRNNLSQASKIASDHKTASTLLTQHMRGLQEELEELREDKRKLEEQLEVVVTRLREEANVEELRLKLQEKTERCKELEIELQDFKEMIERPPLGAAVEPAQSTGGRRSPTLELEGLVRAQLHYSRSLDQDFLHHVQQLPPLDLNTSTTSSSVHSSTSERLSRLHTDNEKLQLQVSNLEARLKDKDALIAELNTIRDKLVQDWQSAKLRYEAERDNSASLQLLLNKQKDTADSLQTQDSSMIEMLKRRLESAMRCEVEARSREQELREQLEMTQGKSAALTSPRKLNDIVDRLKGEISILKSRLECERDRTIQLDTELERVRNSARRDLELEKDKNTGLITQLATVKRQKHESSLELIRAKELLNSQSHMIAELEKRIDLVTQARSPIADALTEMECHKSDLSREIASLKQYITHPRSPPPEHDREQAIRYLHGRCLRLESCRKALIWQKRYLQRVLSGYSELEHALQLHPAPPVRNAKTRFRCAVRAVAATCRWRFLLRRRRQTRPAASGSTAAAPAASGGGVLLPVYSRVCAQAQPGPPSSPGSPLPAGYKSSPAQYMQPTQQYISNTPRGDVATAYMNKLSLVSRCLNRAMDAARDVP